MIPSLFSLAIPFSVMWMWVPANGAGWDQEFDFEARHGDRSIEIELERGQPGSEWSDWVDRSFGDSDTGGPGNGGYGGGESGSPGSGSGGGNGGAEHPGDTSGGGGSGSTPGTGAWHSFCSDPGIAPYFWGCAESVNAPAEVWPRYGCVDREGPDGPGDLSAELYSDAWCAASLTQTPAELDQEEVQQALIEEVETAADAEAAWEQILVQIPGEVEQAFSSLPIDGGQVRFEPELQGFGYVNRHTNVFVDTQPQVFTATLLGIEVEVRAIPTQYQFDYGDGTVATFNDPGGPISGTPSNNAETLADTETPTSHAYQETGVYSVDVSTTFGGEYRLPGGEWTAIEGTAQIAASPGQADIWQISHRHVAEGCEDPDHWGCSGPVELEPGDQPPEIFADQYSKSGRYLGP